MTTTKKMILAGMFACAFTMGMEARAADTLVVTTPTRTVVTDTIDEVDVGDNSIALYDAEQEMQEMGMDAGNFDLASKSGREISDDMYVFEESKGGD